MLPSPREEKGEKNKQKKAEKKQPYYFLYPLYHTPSPKCVAEMFV